MDEDGELDDDRVVEALVLALAAQADACTDRLVAPAVLDDLAACHGRIVRKVLACISHLIHYGAEPEVHKLTALREQLTATLRQVKPPGPGGELPGDVVEVVVDRPQNHLLAGDNVTIRYIGGNDTADVEPFDDYVFETVPLADLKRIRSR